ncbi:MAG: hypothetical protein E6716_19225 [Clostridioides difficile]|mgnify:CR=1|jgi:hypothetical protein|uniref:hypothetical protein n=2 Tax=Clostridium TaxID=1485 RepID=UPI0012B95901|nr:hypothetical protein [Clostridium paraputrificum]MDU2057602.1 hypothetical protein [Clostridioides difficile]
MFRSVSEISVLTGLSKVSIYKKIKQEKFQEFITRNKGITYVSEDGVKLILKEFEVKRVKSDGLNSLNCEHDFENEEVAITIENKGIEEEKEWLKELKVEYINSLKDEIKYLRKQIEKKDNQIQELINLNKNNQVLLKQQQDKEINQLKLEDHIKEFDEKLLVLKEKMEQKRNTKKSFLNIFKY